MLQIILKDIKELVFNTPGFWLLSIFINTADLILDVLRFHPFQIAGDLFLLAAAVMLYFITRGIKHK